MTIPLALEPDRRQWVAGRLDESRERLAARGLIGDHKDRRISARIDGRLLEAARVATGLRSDTDVIEAALTLLADVDDYGAWLNSQAGTLDPDFELDP